jgi:hypothetical protein
MAASLTILPLQHGSRTSELWLLFIAAGAKRLGLGDLDSVV